MSGRGRLGRPRVHARVLSSTNDRARELGLAGAPHGTLVTAEEQTAGRGRQGRRWSAPARGALLMSLLLRDDGPRDPPRAPVPLAAAVALSDAVGPEALIKWPNDIVLMRGGQARKLAGILVEGRPQEGWTVLGIGLNVSLRLEQLDEPLQQSAATLGLPESAVEPLLERLLEALERRLAEPTTTILGAWRTRDVLLGRAVSWAGGAGTARGLDDRGRLIVEREGDRRTALDAGEVHLQAEQAR
jgi:BirA family transcriptional regulator, biotin operon repressor / biotin---[acetyl-CoA-carboxylase] ligase